MGGFRFFLFAFQVSFKFNIALTYEVVAFHSQFFRSVAIFFVEKLVGKHGLADMDSPVVYYVYLVNLRSCLFEDPAYGFTQGIVSHVSQV